MFNLSATFTLFEEIQGLLTINADNLVIKTFNDDSINATLEDFLSHETTVTIYMIVSEEDLNKIGDPNWSISHFSGITLYDDNEVISEYYLDNCSLYK